MFRPYFLLAFSNKRNQDFRRNDWILGLGEEVCKMSLEHCVVFKSIEVLGEERKKSKKEDRHHIDAAK